MSYIFKRLIQMLCILAILSIALFGLLSLMPGNPVDLLITSNPNIRPEDVARLKHIRGLDKPWYVQYVRWVWGNYDSIKPAEIEIISPINFDNTENISFDLSDYVYDPGYFPDSNEALELLTESWPEVSTSQDYQNLIKLINDKKTEDFYVLLYKNNSLAQEKFIKKIKEKSRKNITIYGLFDTQAKGFLLSRAKESANSGLWFYAQNLYGQKKLGYIEVLNNPHQSQNKFMSNIKTQSIYNEDKFLLDLNKFVIEQQNNLTFSLIGNSLGQIAKEGLYSHKFIDKGNSIVTIEALDANNNKQQFAFDIEHGVITDKNKFNKGFLFAFLGDKKAWGFSQTYKRPVYDLLFGKLISCGDGIIDPSEQCEPSMQENCTENCFFNDSSFIDKASTYIAGTIVNSGRIGNTILLMLPAIILSLLIAIPLGVISAYRQYSVLDYIINFLSFIGISLPVFWFGIMVVYVFAEVLKIFPAGGMQTPGIYADGLWAVILDRAKYAILPTVVLSIFYTGIWLRYMRSSMLEVLPKDFIRTARAKGLSETAVVLKHALRNALIPVVTILALSIPSLFGGAVLTETVFSWSGIGRLQYDAVINNDYYVAIVVFLISAMLVMIGNLLADTLYVLIDPRMRKR